MRTLSTELTNAQEADAATPHIEVILKSRSGATTRTYKTDDATNRITRIRTAEGMYGGTIFETRTPDGKTVPIAGQILFNNSDNEFSGLDLRGYKCQVRWGFASYVSGGSTTAISGTKYSEGEPYFVYNHREISSPGVNHTELWLISIWAYMGLQGMFGESFTNKFSSSGNKIRHVLMDTLTRKPDKVFVYDTSASLYRDHTTAALDNTTNFEFLLGGAAPGAAGDVVGDILYIGLPNDNYSEADRITFELARVGAGTWTLPTSSGMARPGLHFQVLTIKLLGLLMELKLEGRLHQKFLALPYPHNLPAMPLTGRQKNGSELESQLAPQSQPRLKFYALECRCTGGCRSMTPMVWRTQPY